ncbi:MAG: RNA methyltransferase [Actinobacteria bacterium]|nr:RNA methyltransferase [Actinomycetota bacterium]
MSDGVRLSGVIESPKNERIRQYRRLRKRNFRYREGKFLVEGQQCVAEALLSKYVPECVICSSKGFEAMTAYADIMSKLSVPCYTAADEVIDSLSATVTPQGIVAVAPLVHVDLDRMLGDKPETILVANRVRDPGNLGNMVRIADAAGAGGMVVCAESADPYNAKTVRSTAGSLFHLPLCVGDDIASVIEALRKHGYAVLGADAHSGTGMWEMEWPGKVAVIMGNEAWGIPHEEEAMVDGMVRVPLIGHAESLNVSAAAAVLLYEIARIRSEGKSEGGKG